MDEQQPRNAAAGAVQQQHQKAEVKTLAEQLTAAGLTRKNHDYMMQLNKQLRRQGINEEQVKTWLTTTIEKIVTAQKTGQTATNLLGTPTAYAESLINPKKPAESRTTSSNPWLLAIDNALMFLAIFTIMFGVMGLMDPKSANINGTSGITAIILVSIVGGALFGAITKLMAPAKDPETGKRLGLPVWLRVILVLVGFMAWIGIYGLTAVMNGAYNPHLNGWIYIVIAVIAFVGDMYFRQKYNVVGGFMGRPMPRETK